MDTKRDLILPGCRIRLHFWTGLLAVIQLGGVIYALQTPPEVAAVASQPQALPVVGGVLWAFLFLVVTYYLIWGRRYAKRIAVAVIVIFASYNIARWVLFTQAEYDRQRLPVLIFSTFCVVVILVATYYDLKAGRPQGTEKSANDIESQD
ncbi:MAG: hypothetical protein DIU68_005860 [Chloroflexota bacterium]